MLPKEEAELIRKAGIPEADQAMKAMGEVAKAMMLLDSSAKLFVTAGVDMALAAAVADPKLEAAPMTLRNVTAAANSLSRAVQKVTQALAVDARLIQACVEQCQDQAAGRQPN